MTETGTVKEQATFEVVPDSERPQRRPGVGRHPSGMSLALEAGQTLFVPAEHGAQVRGTTQKEGYLRRRGFVVRTAGGERNGVRGFFVWAEKAAS